MRNLHYVLLSYCLLFSGCTKKVNQLSDTTAKQILKDAVHIDDAVELSIQQARTHGNRVQAGTKGAPGQASRPTAQFIPFMDAKGQRHKVKGPLFNNPHSNPSTHKTRRAQLSFRALRRGATKGKASEPLHGPRGPSCSVRQARC